MEWLTLSLAGIASAGIVFWGRRWLGRRNRRHAAHAEVKKLKLMPLPLPLAQGADDAVFGLNLKHLEQQLPPVLERLGGEHEGCQVRVWVAGDPDALVVQLLVTMAEKLPGDLTAFRQGGEPAPWLPLAGRVQDIFTGDERFDDAVRVRGSAMHLVRSVLDHARRQSIWSAMQEFPEIQILRQFLVARIAWPGGAGSSVPLGRVLEQMTGLARALTPTPSPVQGLMAIVRDDPEPTVRRRCTESLGRRYLQEPGAAEVLRLALQDKDWLVRLAAARALGDEAMEALAHVLHVSARPWPEFVVTAIAEQGHPAFLPILRSACISSIPAVHALGRMRDLAAVPKLLRAYPTCTRAEHREAILAALGQISAPEAEPLLLRELEYPDNPTQVRAAALAALGSCGSSEALTHLQPFTKVAVGGGLRTVALEAVAAIRARLDTDTVQAREGLEAMGAGSVGGDDPAQGSKEAAAPNPAPPLDAPDSKVPSAEQEYVGEEAAWSGLTLSSLEWQQLGAGLASSGQADMDAEGHSVGDVRASSLKGGELAGQGARKASALEEELKKALDWLEDSGSGHFPKGSGG